MVPSLWLTSFHFQSATLMELGSDLPYNHPSCAYFQIPHVPPERQHFCDCLTVLFKLLL